MIPPILASLDVRFRRKKTVLLSCAKFLVLNYKVIVR